MLISNTLCYTPGRARRLEQLRDVARTLRPGGHLLYELVREIEDSGCFVVEDSWEAVDGTRGLALARQVAAAAPGSSSGPSSRDVTGSTTSS